MSFVHLLLAALALVHCAVSDQADVSGTTIQSEMEKAQIIPDVIDEISDALVQVVYPSGVSVDLGNELTPTSVKDTPTVTWTTEPDTLYTLIMSDPDAPSRADPSLREIRHWLVVNIPGADVAKGDTIVQFIGSGPLEGSGLHRYVFLVYKQPGRLSYDEEFTPNTSTKHRVASSTRGFAKKYNLGRPIAGNYYQAQYDDYVPQLHARFTE